MVVGSKAAEESFKKGLEALGKNRQLEAMALFEAAVTLDARANQDSKGNPRYRSYYGMCLALEGRKYRDGLVLCRKAAEEEFYNHEVWFNLGRAEMEAGNKSRSHQAFIRGLHLAPGKEKKRFQRNLQILGLRRNPFFSFLPRRHFLNTIVGRLTWRLNKEDE